MSKFTLGQLKVQLFKRKSDIEEHKHDAITHYWSMFVIKAWFAIGSLMVLKRLLF